MRALLLLTSWLVLAPALAADEWEQARQRKATDDLRIEAAAGGAFSFSKITYKSTDGLAIPAYLFAPLAPAAAKVGAVIYVHGSQHGQFNSRSLNRVQALVSHGWVVLAPDYRSSTGYTREFHDAADYGGKEIDDMLAARDYLARLPQVDPARIAILGLSHGGYNVLMALAVAPGRFVAGVDFFGPTDLVWRLTAKEGENPNAEAGDREYFARMVGKSIDEAPELYRARSPRFLAQKIVDPLLILHGEKDGVVRVQESVWMAEALERAGHREFSLHIIKDGEHGYPAPQMDEAWNLALEFLGRFKAH
ncbi:MAG: S9 family peptidase [Chromatiales bacterium]|jgi:dipeptidyl aminopeptidase/acylaminoacyl peptidase|nr:MAG: S9 family peptidase [Chromatiales bacterium]